MPFVVTDTFLKDFADQKVQSFINDLAQAKVVSELNLFTGTGSPGPDATGTYNQLLTGNSKGNLGSATRLQSDFKTFATALNTSITELQTAARTLSVDLKMVDSVLKKGGDAAAITAAEMMADLQNITFGSTSSTSKTTTGV